MKWEYGIRVELVGKKNRIVLGGMWGSGSDGLWLGGQKNPINVDVRKISSLMVEIEGGQFASMSENVPI